MHDLLILHKYVYISMCILHNIMKGDGGVIIVTDSNTDSSINFMEKFPLL